MRTRVCRTNLQDDSMEALWIVHLSLLFIHVTEVKRRESVYRDDKQPKIYFQNITRV